MANLWRVPVAATYTLQQAHVMLLVQVMAAVPVSEVWRRNLVPATGKFLAVAERLLALLVLLLFSCSVSITSPPPH
jgi:hypothetical protein